MSAKTCANCKSKKVNNFCSNCGQEYKDYHASFYRLGHDFLGENFNFDSRLWRSLTPLVIKPGFLTRDYMDGHRARYVPPLRLYLFISVLFFAVLALQDDTVKVESNKTIDPPGIMLEHGVGNNVKARLDIIPEADVIPKNRFTEEARTFELEELGTDIYANPQAFKRNFSSNLSLLMFLFLPAYALMLKGFYFFSKRYYMEHLIFSLHLHSFVFLMYLLLVITKTWIAPLFIGWLPGWLLTAISIIGGITIVGYFLLYPLLAMRRAYEESWWLTTLKYFGLGVSYLLILAFGMLGLVFLTATGI